MHVDLFKLKLGIQIFFFYFLKVDYILWITLYTMLCGKAVETMTMSTRDYNSQIDTTAPKD